MAIKEIITANCENGQLSKSKIARQWDDQGTLIQFAGYPEPDTDEQLIFRLIVWMRASEDTDPVELPPIELDADQWLISNYYTQLPQMLRFQLCITNEAGTYEKHSPIFSGIVDKSLSHDGEEAEIDVIPLFDPYKKYVDELVVDAGARVVDTELNETSTNLVQNKAVAKAVANVNGRLSLTEDAMRYGQELFRAAKGGAVTTYPTRVKIPDKTEISNATSILFNDLSVNEFGSDYMVSFTVYDSDETTVIASSDGWKMRNTLQNIEVEKGQFLTLTTKFYPHEIDTSSDGAVETIANAVRFQKTDVANNIIEIDNITKAHTDVIATLRDDALSGYNAYFSFYIGNTGRWGIENRNGVVAKDGTTFNSTAMFIRPTNNLIVVISASPYSNGATISKTWEQVCEEIGDSRVAEIDGKDYVALYANESFCFNIETKRYAVLGASVSKHGYVVLLQQKSRQLNGGYILPKALYDDVSVKIENTNLAVNNVASAVNKITANDYEFPVADIIANRDLQTGKSLMFLWASDTHHQIHGTSTYGVTTKKIAEMSQVAKQAGVDFVCVTGDVVNGYYPIAEQKSCLVNFVNTLRTYYDRPVFIVEGNHDDNSWYASARGSSGTEYTGLAQTIQTDLFTSYVMTNQIDSVQFDESNPLGGYYYYDFPKSKIRCICLNCEDIPYIENADKSLKYYGQWTMAYSEKQLKWLAEKALVFAENGWSVVFFQHNDKQMSGNTQNVINLSLLTQIVDGYRNKTSGTAVSTQADFEANVPYDFSTNSSNEVCAWFAGHTHMDEYELIDGVPHISIINTFNPTGGGYDLVTVDRKNRKIFTKRYNDGELEAYNREISY